jgi:flagellar basal body-associated protein FliL
MDTNTFTIILLVAIGIVTLLYRFLVAKNQSPDANNTELLLEKLRPILLEILNKTLEYNTVVTDYETYVQYWVDYCNAKVQSINELTKEEKAQINPLVIRMLIEPVLKQVWGLGKRK